MSCLTRKPAGAPRAPAGFASLQIESNILTIDTMQTRQLFHDFELDESLLRALAEEKYLTPTPIQAQTIPTGHVGRDVIGIAQTGTGKTAAFALPILHRLAADPRPATRRSCRVLVLSPTRELSGQILDSFRTYGRHLRIRAALAIGGVSMGEQVRALLNGVDVLVATPGPAPRSRAKQCASPRRGRMPGAGRSRPHARHGLYPRHPQNRREASGATANLDVLRHHASRYCRTCRADVARSGEGRGGAGGLHGRAR